MQIRLAGIAPESIVDGPGLRFTVFAQGCPRKCADCHNPHTHDFGGGKFYDTDEIISKIKDNPLLDGITFSGGEPMCQAEAFSVLAEGIVRKNITGFNIYCYTGYTFEELIALSDAGEGHIKRLLSLIDVLVDGPYDENKKSMEIKFKGSSNQRVLNSKESVRQDRAVLLN